MCAGEPLVLTKGHLLHALEECHLSKHVMVIAPSSDAAPVISALRDRGLEAWCDRIGRVALDFVSFDWADALVVIDRTPQLETEHVRPVVEFPGVKILCTPMLLDSERRAALIERGFDAVTEWPASPNLVAAMATRFLARGAVQVDRRAIGA